MAQILNKRLAYGQNIRHQSKKKIWIVYLKHKSDNNLEVMFSNVKKVMSILLTTSATNALVETPNFALHFIKTDYRSTMSEDHFNAPVLLYVHWDIKLDYNRIIQIYANKYPRRLLLINPLLESWKSLIYKIRTLCFVYSFMFIIVRTLTSFLFNAFFQKGLLCLVSA